ncbi:ser/Thr protein phosphatase [Nemania sp. NC0429]|nr:ser/Thr protein phosphatase [Nemania sp. NC0429]
MDLTPVKVATMILKHYGVATCVVGEIVLNYYNVPRICHDIEICVSKSTAEDAASYLCSTGLFEPVHEGCDFNEYTEYRRHMPRVRTTSWISSTQVVVIFPADLFGLDPIEKILVGPLMPRKVHLSKEIRDLSPEDVASLPLPRLAPLLKGLARRFLDRGDDMAMIGVEQLVDGMDLDHQWVQRHLDSVETPVTALILERIQGKKGRIDYYSDNLVTCYISDREEAGNGRLNDAAIALHRILSREGINFGIFGGYAIGAVGGVRESKDVDCLASITKAQVIQLLDNQEGFRVIPQSREDYVAFFWSDQSDSRNAVLVEIFCEQFPGARYTMQGVICNTMVIKGVSFSEGTSCFLDPFYLFKGKLRASAARNKFHDSVDLRMLISRYESIIKPRVNELNLEYIGLSIKRYPELERLFNQLGVDVEKARLAAADLDPNNISPPAVGDVQNGLLG